MVKFLVQDCCVMLLQTAELAMEIHWLWAHKQRGTALAYVPRANGFPWLNAAYTCIYIYLCIVHYCCW